MSRFPRVLASVALAVAVAACQTGDGGDAVEIAPPVAGQAAEVIEGSGQTDQDYDLVPGADGRVFLVLDCAAAETAQSLTARRVDGKGWGPASPGPELSVPCDPDGQRLAILVTGTARSPIPLRIRTTGDRWRVAQTHQRPNG